MIIFNSPMTVDNIKKTTKKMKKW